MQSPSKEGISMNNVQVLEYASPPKKQAFSGQEKGANSGNKGDNGENLTILTNLSKINSKENQLEYGVYKNQIDDQFRTDTEKELFENMQQPYDHNKPSNQQYQYDYHNIEHAQVPKQQNIPSQRQIDRKKQKSQVKREKKLQEELDKILSDEFLNVLQSERQEKDQERLDDKEQFIDFNQLAVITESNFESVLSMSQFLQNEQQQQYPEANYQQQQYEQYASQIIHPQSNLYGSQYQQQQQQQLYGNQQNYYGQQQQLQKYPAPYSPNNQYQNQQFQQQLEYYPYAEQQKQQQQQQKYQQQQLLKPVKSQDDGLEMLKNSFQLDDDNIHKYYEQEMKYFEELKKSERSTQKQKPLVHIDQEKAKINNHQQNSHNQVQSPKVESAKLRSSGQVSQPQQQQQQDMSNQHSTNQINENSGSTNDNGQKQLEQEQLLRIGSNEENNNSKQINVEDIHLSPLKLSKEFESNQSKLESAQFEFKVLEKESQISNDNQQKEKKQLQRPSILKQGKQNSGKCQPACCTIF